MTNDTNKQAPLWNDAELAILRGSDRNAIIGLAHSLQAPDPQNRDDYIDYCDRLGSCIMSLFTNELGLIARGCVSASGKKGLPGPAIGMGITRFVRGWTTKNDPDLASMLVESFIATGLVRNAIAVDIGPADDEGLPPMQEQVGHA